jgi:hypothetical protein
VSVLLKYAVEMDLGGIRGFMTTGSGIQAILMLLPLHVERLQCWY